MHYLSEQNIFLFLIQIFLLLGLSRVLGEIFRMVNLLPLTAEILVGIFLGPTILGRFFPSWHSAIFPLDPLQQSMLETVAWLGVFFLLLEVGLEIDFTSAWQQRGDAVKIAVVGILVPIVLSFFALLFLPDHYLIVPQQKIIFALFMSVVLAITAMPVVSRVLYDLSLLKTDLAFLIISAHSVNDIIGWLLLTLILIFFKTGDFAFHHILFLLTVAIGFVGICLTVGRTLADKTITFITRRQMPEPSTSLTFICLLGLFCGAITQRIGLHALLGFFIAGIMVGGSRSLSEKTRHVISQMVFAIFIPLFFTNLGLRIDFFKNFDLFLVVFISVLGIGGKFLGGWLGSIITKQTRLDTLTIAIAHIPGGMMEIVIGMLALHIGLISEKIFVAVIFGAIISSIAVGPWLHYSMNRRKKINIFEYFSKRAVIAELKGSERDQVIRELCELASGFPQMPAVDTLIENVLQRERDMGTAIEEGVALPHARLPFLKNPVIIFGRSIAGVEWNSQDGKPSHFIFLILNPAGHDEAQVQILRSIATVMGDPFTLDHLLKVKDTDEIWQILQKNFSIESIKRQI